MGPDRLRFDFTHFTPMTPEEIEEVENLVNEQVRRDLPIATDILAREEAIQGGATALFGEKYADKVRVVSMGSFSKELCGGTHAGATGEIGLFKIITESGIAAGVRRIEAIAGSAAFAHVQRMNRRVRKLGELLNVRDEELVEKVETLLAAQKRLEKQVADLSARLATSDLDTILNNTIEVDGVKVLAAEIPLDSPKTLREVGDKVRDNLGPAWRCLAVRSRARWHCWPLLPRT